jgi:D-alanyl-lipoteichoic acid acyltransferase DltB (MBOAT superfamily)
MLFTTFTFFIFLPIVLGLYWLFRKNLVLQNLIILISSYVFYCWWNYWFGVLLLFSSSFCFLITRLIGKTNHEKKRYYLLLFGLAVHIGILCYFKYFVFFVQSILTLLSFSHINIAFNPPNIVLPLAISFFTFHLIGYMVDVYQKKYSYSDKYFEFITHVAFFPQLVAGPIERASHLLPQFLKERTVSAPLFRDGLRQMLWGFFKKIVVADTIALPVNYIFLNYENLDAVTIATGALLFSIQIYCDFSGYSDIAIGCAKLMGFELFKNFNYPFFAQSATEFWRRWHISFTTWMNDYIFTPLAFSKRDWGVWGLMFATLISFILSGLWHGANWTFVLWGLLYGIAFAYEINTKKIRKRWAKTYHPDYYAAFSRLATFSFWVFTSMLFRSESLSHFWGLLNGLADLSNLKIPDIEPTIFLWPLLLITVEWYQRNKEYGLAIQDLPYYIRWTAYAAIIVAIFSSDNLNNQSQFIYFQF